MSDPEHEITTTPDIFLLNTSNFEVFKRGSSYNDPNDNVSWEVKEDFIAFNGWNNNQSDKMTVNKYFQFLFVYDDDEMTRMYLGEISFLNFSFKDFMRINGEFSNTLVKFFKDRDTDLV